MDATLKQTGCWPMLVEVTGACSRTNGQTTYPIVSTHPRAARRPVNVPSHTEQGDLEGNRAHRPRVAAARPADQRRGRRPDGEYQRHERRRREEVEEVQEGKAEGRQVRPQAPQALPGQAQIRVRVGPSRPSFPQRTDKALVG